MKSFFKSIFAFTFLVGCFVSGWFFMSTILDFIFPPLEDYNNDYNRTNLIQ